MGIELKMRSKTGSYVFSTGVLTRNLSAGHNCLDIPVLGGSFPIDTTITEDYPILITDSHSSNLAQKSIWEQN
jgi:hypothetical protein